MTRRTLHAVVLLIVGCASRGTPVAQGPPAEATIRTLIDGLMSSQAGSREMAQELLVGMGIVSAAQIREVLLTPTVPPDPGVAEEIRGLSADDIRTRRDAAEALLRRGRSAEPELWKVLMEETTPLEVSLPAEEILSKLIGGNRQPGLILKLLSKRKVEPVDRPTLPLPEARIVPLKKAEVGFPRTKIEDDFSLQRGLRSRELLPLTYSSGKLPEDEDFDGKK